MPRTRRDAQDTLANGHAVGRWGARIGHIPHPLHGLNGGYRRNWRWGGHLGHAAAKGAQVGRGATFFEDFQEWGRERYLRGKAVLLTIGVASCRKWATS